MNRARVQNAGWAAFDRKLREEPTGKNDSSIESFPSISDLIQSTPVNSSITNSPAVLRPFSSVVQPVKSAGSRVNNKSKLLKEEHVWADQNLIEDILAAVNGDFDQASAILKSMVSIDPELEACELPSLNLKDDEVESKQSNNFHKVVVASKLFSVPAEPEWEEDDVYLNHRKDAMKMMRTASHHSRAASNAFLRGDHVAAHEFSSRAREEQMAAERLNKKAAEEILRIRNANNDIWKIDLHGLHASEAVDSVKKRLDQIESDAKTGSAGIPAGPAKNEADVGKSSSLGPVKSYDVYSKPQKPSSQNRHGVLEVITGSGNHSKGQAALPVAVRSFLIENGYRFDEARPGVITVRPKFRR